MAKHTPDIAVVLEFVNSIRAAFALPTITQLPAGVRESVTDCPMGRGIGIPGIKVNEDGLASDTAAHAEKLEKIIGNVTYPSESMDGDYEFRSALVRQFTKAFDNGLYPALIEAPAEAAA